MTQDQRAEFEAWYASRHETYDTTFIYYTPENRYQRPSVDESWSAYQAGRGALRAERDELRDVLDRIVSYYDMLRHNGRMPSMAYQAASDHENTMFGQARILLAKEQP